jgi:hypothetical protein
LGKIGGEAAEKASPAQLGSPLGTGRGERTSSSGNFEFVPSLSAGELKYPQTPKENKFSTGHAFEIILPNLIHKSKKRNLT